MSAATSHSAHLYHLPLPFSFCWQIKIHGLPSHPFSLRCLIVSKIEEITGRNFCTNKNLSGTWQCVTWHTHTCAWGIPLWIAGGIPQNPNLLSFLFPPPGSSCWAIKKYTTEGRATLEGRKIPHWETDGEHTSSLSVSWCRPASSFLEGHIIIVVTGRKRTLDLCDFYLVKFSHRTKVSCATSGAPGFTSFLCICFPEAVASGTWWQLLREGMNHCIFRVSTNINLCFLKQFLYI